MSGAGSHFAGHSAEEQVAQHYLRRGYDLVARCWRSPAGEIDLILRGAEGLVFVEVKSAPDLARAAERLGPRQVARIRAAASVFVASEPAGQDSAMRFDLALVDAAGRIEVIENAFGT